MNAQSEMNVGISGFAVRVPPYRVSLEDWCAWTGGSWEKTRSVVGRGFRMAGPEQSIYTLAAEAVLALIEQYDIDPARVGMLAFGTESSTDNAAGAVILKGMVDRALKARGQVPLSRRCEVPEVKHACLGGVYALKDALRWAALDGRGQQAIVVAADIAEYERGSTGEPTQGAGAVAMLVESNPRLLEIDLTKGGSAAAYRGLDFRKPTRRFHDPGYATETARPHDFPVFNGRYSNACYLDEVLEALDAAAEKRGVSPRALLEEPRAIFFHRPYHYLPRQALGLALLRARVLDEDGALPALADEAGLALDEIRDECRVRPELDPEVERLPSGVLPRTTQLLKTARAGALGDEVDAKLALGSEPVMELGNLYTASLFAWLAGALDEAAAGAEERAGEPWLAVGYGSGDAAEALPLRVAAGWRAAAAQIRLKDALAGAVDLDAESYGALHDRGVLAVAAPRSPGFVVERVGDSLAPDRTDVGVEYYRYVAAPGA